MPSVVGVGVDVDMGNRPLVEEEEEGEGEEEGEVSVPISVMVTIVVAVFPIGTFVVSPPSTTAPVPKLPVPALIFVIFVVVVLNVYLGLPSTDAPVVGPIIVTFNGYHGLPIPVPVPIPAPVPGTVTAVTATVPNTIGLFPTVAVMFALTIPLAFAFVFPIILSPGTKAVTRSVDTGIEKETKDAPRVVLMMLFRVMVTSGAPTVAVRVVIMDHEPAERERGGGALVNGGRGAVDGGGGGVQRGGGGRGREGMDGVGEI